MKTTTLRALGALFLLMQMAPAAYSSTITFDQRVDAQQITEVRIDAPPGCVITGLGFRAHEDNITTMVCRYHRVSADGRLVDPREERAGSDPDHACEAEIMLPEGYYAVGYGARGAPEWDVTTLRIWARKLAPGGRAGKLEVFSAGTVPDSALEREALPPEPDRALTGAGLRFQFNNIGGLYARTCRIQDVPDAIQHRKLPVAGWIVDPALRTNPAVAAGIKGRKVKKVYTSEKDVPKGLAVLDASNGLALQPELPVARVDELARQAAGAALQGSRGVVIRVTSGAATKDALNKLNLEAAYLLADDPFMWVQEVWDRVTSGLYGPASPDATEALKWIASARELMIHVLGQKLTGDQGQMLDYSAMRRRLENQTPGKARAAAATELLAPAYTTLDLVSVEGATADWALRIASQAADRAVQKRPSEESRALVSTVQAYAGRSAFWQSAKEAFVSTSLYARDGADSTRASASNAAAEILKAADGGEAPPDADRVARSISGALAELAGKDRISLAARQVEKLLGEDRQDQAAAAVAKLLNDPNEQPYLSHRNDTIVALVSRLKAIYDDPGLRVLRGGDGTWALEQTGGRWALRTSEDSRCIYLDVTSLAMGPGDYVLSFEYFDSGNVSISLQYDSQYETDREYHPAESVQAGDTNTWKRASIRLPNASLAGRQNGQADLRLLGPKPFSVRGFSFARE